MSVIMDVSRIAYCCGVNVVGNFRGGAGKQAIAPTSGTEFLVGTFVNTKACRKAYEYLSRELEVHAQTEPRHNVNSGRKVFVAVFGPKRVPQPAQRTGVIRTAHIPLRAALFERPGEKLPRL